MRALVNWKNLRWLPLGLIFVWTVQAQASWTSFNTFTWIGIAMCWGILVLGWLASGLVALWKGREIPNSRSVLPLALVLVAVLQFSHVPLYLHFLLQRSKLGQWLHAPEIRGQSQILNRSSPFQLVHKNGATRIVLTADSGVFEEDAKGFAYCPNGCEKIDFPQYGSRSDSHHEYFPLWDGWYATRFLASGYSWAD